jgi:hypothetical protein
VDNPPVYDYSDANFTIAGYTVTYPTASGLHWFIGYNYTITWTYVGVTDSVNIKLNRSYPSENWVIIGDHTFNDGSYTWHVTGPESTTCRIKVENANNANNYDISKNNFMIIEPE